MSARPKEFGKQEMKLPVPVQSLWGKLLRDNGTGQRQILMPALIHPGITRQLYINETLVYTVAFIYKMTVGWYFICCLSCTG